MRLGVLGAGRMGALRASILTREPGVERVLIGSRDPGRARRLADSISVAGAAACASGSVEEVLAAEPDAVVVALATAAHVEVLLACARAGIPTLCEKPVALDLAGTRTVIAAYEEAGVPLQVAFQRRFDPAYARVHDLIRGGALGTLYTMRLAAHDAQPSPEDYIPGSGGIFRDMAVHDVDVVRWVTGREVATVYAVGALRLHDRYARYGDVDTCAIVLTLDDGMPVVVTAARHNPLGYDVRLEVQGSADSVAVGLAPWTPVRSLEDGADPPERTPPGFVERFAEAFTRETRAFVAFVRAFRAGAAAANPCPARNALEALRVAIACERSREEGRAVLVSEVGS